MTETAAERPPPDLRLLPAAALSWPAAWWATAAGVRADLGVAVIVILLAVGVLAALRSGRGRPARPAAITVLASLPVAPPAVALVLAVAAATLTTRDAGPLPCLIAQTAVIEARGRVTSDPDPIAAGMAAAGYSRDLPPRYAVRLHLERVSGRGRSVASDAPVLVLGCPGWAAVSTGHRVIVTGRLKAAEPGDDIVALLAALAGP